MDRSTSRVALLVSIGSLAYFVSVMMSVALEFRVTPQAVWIYKKLEGYEHFFMIAQINFFFQLFSLLLHIFAHFSSKFDKARDFVFANLAFPYSISTMVTFWTFWFFIGKRRVFPQDASILYPLWVTHGFHTLSPVVNIITLLFMRHDYGNNVLMFTYCFTATYFSSALLMFIITGSFMKAYIEKFTSNELCFYYCAFAVFAHFTYMCGCLINNRLHRDALVADIRARRSASNPQPPPGPPTTRPPGPGRRPDIKTD